MYKQLKILCLILISFTLFFASGSKKALAVRPKQLGEVCKKSHECGVNLGCRLSELGDYKVCKITVPGTDGCDQDIGENPCADGMYCHPKDLRCTHTYGIEDLAPGNFRMQVEPPNNPTIHLPDFTALGVKLFGTDLDNRTNQKLTSQNGLSTAEKIFSIFLAIAFLAGVILFFKGLLVRKNSIGYLPMNRQGWTFFGFGLGMILSSIFLWIIFL